MIGVMIANSIQQFPQEQQYWEKGQAGLVTFPDVRGKIGMSHDRYVAAVNSSRCASSLPQKNHCIQEASCMAVCSFFSCAVLCVLLCYFFRYSNLLSSFQFEDYDSISVEKRNADRAWKVRRVTNSLRRLFKGLVSVWGEYLVVDEGMLRCTCQLCGLTQVNPNKPIDEGLKFFMLVDYETGLLVDFMLDNGDYNRQAFRDRPWGSSGEVVLDLVADFANSGRVVITDNYYTSPALSKELYRRGFYHLGTWRKTRGVPDCVKMDSKGPTQKCPKGAMNLAINREGNIPLAAIGFMDNRECYMLDTKWGHCPALVHRIQKDGTRLALNLLKAVLYYNFKMGAVDQLDMLRCGWYSVAMRGRRSRWTVRYFEGLIDMTIATVLRIWNCMYKGNPDKELSHFDVMLMIQEYLIDPDKNVYVRNKRGVEGGDSSRTSNSYKRPCAPMVTPTKESRNDNPGGRFRRKQCSYCKRHVTIFRCSSCSEAICKDNGCLLAHSSVCQGQPV